MGWRVIFRFLVLWFMVMVCGWARGDGGIEYQFERMWPTLENDWNFALLSDVVVSRDGLVYVADDVFNGRVVVLAADGSNVTQWSLSEAVYVDTYGTHRVGGLAVAGDGSIYYVNGNLAKYSAEGGVEWVVETGEFSAYSRVAVDFFGRVYAATWSQIVRFNPDGGNRSVVVEGNIREFAVIEDLLVVEEDCWDEEASAWERYISVYDLRGVKVRTFLEGDLFSVIVSRITASDDGNILVLLGDARLYKVTVQGDVLSELDLSVESFGDFPVSVASKDGYIYLLGNVGVYKFDAEGRLLMRWSGAGSDVGMFLYPRSVSLSDDGFVYVLDSGNCRIQKLLPVYGKFIDYWGGCGAEEGRLSPSITGIDVDRSGSVYVLDNGNKRVEVYSSVGEYLRQWPIESPYEYLNGAGLALSSQNDVYVVNRSVLQLLRYDRLGSLLDTIDLIAMPDLVGDWEPYEVSFYGVDVDSVGQIYVMQPSVLGHTDVGGGILKFDAEGNIVERLAQDVEGLQVRAADLAVDEQGRMIVADTGNRRILVLSPQGELIAKFGRIGSKPGEFQYPYGVDVDSEGRIYVIDYRLHRLQSFIPVERKTRKAILLQGRNSSGDGLRNAFLVNMNQAYRTLLYQGYRREDIQYLSDEPNRDFDGNTVVDDVDGPATKQALAEALGQWAADAEELLVYLIDHGGDGTFRVNPQEILTAEELDAMLDALQQSYGIPVTVIYEACYSGSFLPRLTPPAGTKRIVVASTAADQESFMLENGLISFSHFFWSGLFAGQDFEAAFSGARQAVALQASEQTAVLDANGNGLGNEKQDMVDVTGLFLGNGTAAASAPPVISEIFPPRIIRRGEAATLWVDGVTGTAPIGRVWAVIYPPGFGRHTGQGVPVTELPTVELTKNDTSGRYEGWFEEVSRTGEYVVTVFAMDTTGAVSSPVQSRVIRFGAVHTIH